MRCRTYKARTVINLIYAEYKRQQEEQTYRIYITEAIKLLTENTAKVVRGQMISERYYEIINHKQKHEEKKSGDEVVLDIVDRAGLELV